MRLLHTGDWHVGRAIRGRSRVPEFDEALGEVVGIAEQEGVDAVLVAGDLYDQRSPAPEADGLVFEALVRLYQAGIPVVLSTRSLEGRTIAKYGAQVGAKDLVRLGVILSGDLAPAKARILLMVLLAVSQDNDELTRLFADASP